MPLLSLVIVLIVVGVGLWLVNTYLAAVIDAKILRIINIVVVVCVVLWLLSVLGLFDSFSTIRVPRLR